MSVNMLPEFTKPLRLSDQYVFHEPGFLLSNLNFQPKAKCFNINT